MDFRPEFSADLTTPIYQQIADYFGELIGSGQLSPGDRLPATRELAGQLGLNRTTVSAAYELLEERGFLSGQVGRGSFVASPKRSAEFDWAQIVRPVPSRPFTSGASQISFAASRPRQELFPVEDFRRTCEEVLSADGIETILQLGAPGGYEPLRQYLIEEARAEGAMGPKDDLLITNGCQQALDLIARTVVLRSTRVAIEDPVYPGLRGVLAEAGATLTELPIGASGFPPETLAASGASLAIVTPSFQNPTGVTWSLERRQSLLEVASRKGIALIENDIYSGLRYEGSSLPSLKHLDPGAGTVLLRSFSKIAFPGLRLGWVIGPRPLLDVMRERKQLTDLHSDQFSQAVMLRFAESGRLAAHRERVIEAGREQLRASLQAAAEFLPAGSYWTKPEGGFNLWVTLPEGVDTAALLERALREGLSYLPGSVFAANAGYRSALRLSFGALTPEQIREGIQRLGRISRQDWETRKRQREQPEPALV